MEIISSHDIEDNYLTNIVSVSKLLRLSTKLEMKYIQALNKQIKRAWQNATLNSYSRNETHFQDCFYYRVQGFIIPNDIIVNNDSIWT